MRVWVMLLMTVLLVALLAAACEDGAKSVPQAPTPTLSKDEAWSIVVDKAVAACPGNASLMRQRVSGRYDNGAWRFDLQYRDPYVAQFTVYEKTRTVTGNELGLKILGGYGCNQ